MVGRHPNNQDIDPRPLMNGESCGDQRMVNMVMANIPLKNEVIHLVNQGQDGARLMVNNGERMMVNNVLGTRIHSEATNPQAGG